MKTYYCHNCIERFNERQLEWIDDVCGVNEYGGTPYHYEDTVPVCPYCGNYVDDRLCDACSIECENERENCPWDDLEVSL